MFDFSGDTDAYRCKIQVFGLAFKPIPFSDDYQPISSWNICGNTCFQQKHSFLGSFTWIDIKNFHFKVISLLCNITNQN